MFHQHLSQVSEQIWFCWTEEAGLDLVYSQFQLRQTIVVLCSIVAAENGKQCIS